MVLGLLCPVLDLVKKPRRKYNFTIRTRCDTKFAWFVVNFENYVLLGFGWLVVYRRVVSEEVLAWTRSLEVGEEGEVYLTLHCLHQNGNELRWAAMRTILMFVN